MGARGVKDQKSPLRKVAGFLFYSVAEMIAPTQRRASAR